MEVRRRSQQATAEARSWSRAVQLVSPLLQELVALVLDLYVTRPVPIPAS
jgi:hypothetical protein